MSGEGESRLIERPIGPADAYASFAAVPDEARLAVAVANKGTFIISPLPT